MLTIKNNDVLPLRGDLNGKILVLNEKLLGKDYKNEKFQLWIATNARGNTIFADCLWDNESTQWDRHNFIGIYAFDNVKMVRQLMTVKNNS